MTSISDKLLRRVRAMGRGKVVCTSKDFSDLGSRAAVDQALSRLVKAGKVRRIARGLYDLPRYSAVLKGPAPVSLDAAIAAIARRDGIRVMPDGLVAANTLGLTTAVPAKPDFVTDGATRTVRIHGWTVRFRHVRPNRMMWAGRPAASVVQALSWLGPRGANDPKTVRVLRDKLPASVKQDLVKGTRTLPSWAASVVDKVVEENGAVA